MISAAAVTLLVGCTARDRQHRATAPMVPAAEQPAAQPIVPEPALVIETRRRGGRWAVYVDPIEHELLTGGFTPPTVGRHAAFVNDAQHRWLAVERTNGSFRHPSATESYYVYLPVEVDTAGAYLLDARGHGMVWVNGEPRAGDVYGTGWMSLPVWLHEGRNALFFLVSRGELRVTLTPTGDPLVLTMTDTTMPLATVGQPIDTWGAVPLLNTTDRKRENLIIETRCGATTATRTVVAPIPPISLYKAPFRMVGPAPKATQPPVQFSLRVLDAATDHTLIERTITLGVVKANDEQRHTYRSRVDGSIQYYVVRPARPKADATPGDQLPAMLLTLHGANVLAERLSSSYDFKDWLHHVAPTNRRRFGFSWEDFGRIDAMEALADARRRHASDPRRTYASGHSMGGHGAWHLGVTYPDQFAAIGPSAGWISFWSYGSGPSSNDLTPAEALLRRCMNPSDTLALTSNLETVGIYILHGERDDNVPVDQARQMREVLARFHTDFAYYEMKGAGHFWGPQCVDWPPMMDLFKRHVLPDPAEMPPAKFTTVSPAVSASYGWATIETQITQAAPSSIDLEYDRTNNRFFGTTTNVARLRFDLSHAAPETPLTFEIDGVTIEHGERPTGTAIWLTRAGAQWTAADERPTTLKHPARHGPFKQVFDHRVLFVYGTRGTDAEAAWAFNAARYAAETFYYRGNGAIEIAADRDVDFEGTQGRSVVLFGNADTNAAWADHFRGSPVQVYRGALRVGRRRIAGDDLGGVFIYPRPRSDVELVGAVTGTGLAGMRAVTALPLFVGGVQYPDVFFVTSDMAIEGGAAIRVVGFFGNDWSIEEGEFLWQEHPHALYRTLTDWVIRPWK